MGGRWGGGVRGVLRHFPCRSHRQAGPSTASVCSSSKGLGGVPQGGGGGWRQKIWHGGKGWVRGEGGPIRVCLFQTLLGRKPRRTLHPNPPLSYYENTEASAVPLTLTPCPLPASSFRMAEDLARLASELGFRV